MSNDKREADNVAPAAPLALNKETLGDLDVDAADGEQIRGGVSGSGGSMPPSRAGYTKHTANTHQSTH